MSLKERKLSENLKKNHSTLYVMTPEQIIKAHKNYQEKYMGIANTAANYTAPTMDFIALKNMISELGVAGRVEQKLISGKKYIIFKGSYLKRKIFTSYVYKATDAKVIDMAIGKAGVSNSIRSGARLTIFLTVPLVVIDHILRDKLILTHLLADLASSIIKVGVAAIISAVAATAMGAVTTVAAAPLAIALFVGLAVGWGLQKLDEKFSLTKQLTDLLDEMESNTIGKVNKGMWEIEQKLRWQITNGQAVGKGIFYP